MLGDGGGAGRTGVNRGVGGVDMDIDKQVLERQIAEYWIRILKPQDTEEGIDISISRALDA